MRMASAAQRFQNSREFPSFPELAMKSRKIIIGVAALMATLPMASPTNAAIDSSSLETRIEELESKVRRLEALLQQQSVQVESCARVEEVEDAVASCAKIDEVEEAIAEAPTRLTLYDETEVKVGGYIKMDALLSDYSNAPIRGVGEDLFIPGTINTSGQPEDPRLNFHAKETRFWLKSFTPTDRGDITTHFEIDFLLGQQGNERVGNSFSARIRHAALNWGRWTVGQTWTNFFNTSTLPEYLDFVGPVGVTFGRQAQIRYTLPTDNGSWAFSLENPETTLTPNGGGPRIDADDGTFPDLVVRRNWSGDWGNVSVAALIRELKVSQAGLEDAETGGAIGVAGKFRVGEGDDIRWQFNYGNALGRYMGLNAFNAGTLNANNEISLTTQYGVLAAYRHVWNERLHSSFGASFARSDNDVVISGLAAPEAYQSAHADIIWSPIERMSIGAEYIWGRREDEGGEDGTLNRLQLSAKYLY